MIFFFPSMYNSILASLTLFYASTALLNNRFLVHTYLHRRPSPLCIRKRKTNIGKLSQRKTDCLSSSKWSATNFKLGYYRVCVMCSSEDATQGLWDETIHIGWGQRTIAGTSVVINPFIIFGWLGGHVS